MGGKEIGGLLCWNLRVAVEKSWRCIIFKTESIDYLDIKRFFL